MPQHPATTEDPRVTRSRAAIVTAARECFAASGYDDTSVDEIADRSGVTKRTIYNIYGDKETLFHAAVDASLQIAASFIAEIVGVIRHVDDPARDLPRIAQRLAHDVFLGPVVALRRLLAHEARRFPELAARYRDEAPEAVLRALRAEFRELAARGALKIEDPDLAAEHFAFLVLGAELDRRMLGAAPSDAAAIEKAAASGAAVFLRAYAAGGETLRSP